MKDLLVLRLSALGDVIHTLPAVALLRDSLPGLELSWAVEAPYAGLVEVVGGVHAIPLRLRKWGREPVASSGDAAAALRALRGHRISVDFQGLVKSAMLGAFAGAGERWGFAAEAIREKPARLFSNHEAAVEGTAHVVEQNLQLATAVIRGQGRVPGFDAGPARFVEDFTRFAADPAGKLGGLDGSIVLLPGAGKPNKLWPVERFRTVAQHFGSAHVVVAWGPGEESLAQAIGGRIAPATNLRELAWLLRRARLVIGADTGPLHLAAALGTAVTGLYGPTDPRRNGPWGQLARCVSYFDTTKCMESISVEDVVTSAERTLGE
jgi:heptosyltransferase-1